MKSKIRLLFNVSIALWNPSAIVKRRCLAGIIGLGRNKIGHRGCVNGSDNASWGLKVTWNCVHLSFLSIYSEINDILERD